MAFDDIVREADLKCRASRFARVRQEVKASDEDLVRIYDRGKDNLLHVLDHLAVGGQWGPQARAEAIRAARVAALVDDAGTELAKTLVKHGAAPLPVKAQTILWVKKRRGTTA